MGGSEMARYQLFEYDNMERSKRKVASSDELEEIAESIAEKAGFRLRVPGRDTDY